MGARLHAVALAAAIVLGAGGSLPSSASGALRDQAPVEYPGRLRVALLPFNLLGVPAGSWDRVRQALAAALPCGRIELVGHEAVKAGLRAHRLRDMSLLSRREMMRLAESLGADRLLLGTIYRLDEEPSPRVSLSGRLIDPSRLGIEALAFTVMDGSTLLGPLGVHGPVSLERTLEEAMRKFATSLLASRRRLPSRGHHELLKTSALAPSPVVFASPLLRQRRIERVVVLPFRNRSGHLGAGQAAADLVSWCLMASTRISLYDAGDATRRLLERGWRTGMAVSRAQVQSLGVDPGVDAVLMGEVGVWEEGSPSADQPPKVAVSFRLLDASNGAILWAAEHERAGDETRVFYEAGNVRLVETLMVRAALEALRPLVEALKDAGPAHPDPGGSHQ